LPAQRADKAALHDSIPDHIGPDASTVRHNHFFFSLMKLGNVAPPLANDDS
jgi:hypothetical protein